GLSAGLALAVGKVISELVDRSRPFVVDPSGVHLFSGHSADPGFPSDHATGAFAVAMAIWLRDRRWGTIALLAAAVLSIGRVAIGVLFPRPLRTRVDRFADLLGRPLERGLRALHLS